MYVCDHNMATCQKMNVENEFFNILYVMLSMWMMFLNHQIWKLRIRETYQLGTNHIHVVTITDHTSVVLERREIFIITTVHDIWETKDNDPPVECDKNCRI